MSLKIAGIRHECLISGTVNGLFVLHWNDQSQKWQAEDKINGFKWCAPRHCMNCGEKLPEDPRSKFYLAPEAAR